MKISKQRKLARMAMMKHGRFFAPDKDKETRANWSCPDGKGASEYHKRSIRSSCAIIFARQSRPLDDMAQEVKDLQAIIAERDAELADMTPTPEQLIERYLAGELFAGDLA